MGIQPGLGGVAGFDFAAQDREEQVVSQDGIESRQVAERFARVGRFENEGDARVIAAIIQGGIAPGMVGAEKKPGMFQESDELVVGDMKNLVPGKIHRKQQEGEQTGMTAELEDPVTGTPPGADDQPGESRDPKNIQGQGKQRGGAHRQPVGITRVGIIQHAEPGADEGEIPQRQRQKSVPELLAPRAGPSRWLRGRGKWRSSGVNED